MLSRARICPLLENSIQQSMQLLSRGIELQGVWGHLVLLLSYGSERALCNGHNVSDDVFSVGMVGFVDLPQIV